MLNFLRFSWCRDCVALTVKIIYNGKPDDIFPHQLIAEIERYVDEEIIPHVGWMMSLESLVLIKLGSFEDQDDDEDQDDEDDENDDDIVSSFMLLKLFDWLIPDNDEQPHPNSLSHFWIQGFHYTTSANNDFLNTPSLKAYREDPAYRVSGDLHLNFHDVEHFAGIIIEPLEHLQNLKSVYGEFGSNQDPQEVILHQ